LNAALAAYTAILQAAHASNTATLLANLALKTLTAAIRWYAVLPQAHAPAGARGYLATSLLTAAAGISAIRKPRHATSASSLYVAQTR
jgi:hypothetical protein